MPLAQRSCSVFLPMPGMWMKVCSSIKASRLREFYSYLSRLRIILKSDKFDVDFSFKNLSSRENRMKMRRDQDEEIKGKIATALRAAVVKSAGNAEGVAAKLKISTATLYKYMNGDMIPGGQILWRACEHLPIVLDKDGLHPPRRSRSTKALKDVTRLCRERW